MKIAILAVVALMFLPGCACLHLRPGDSTVTQIAKIAARVPVAVLTLGISELWHQQERIMSSWLGHTESELVAFWGPPGAVINGAFGRRALVYTENRMYTSPGYATSTSTGSGYGQVYGNAIYVQGQAQSFTTYTPPQTYQWRVWRAFVVDSTGGVINYAWSGL
jgi:hypothetical protein